MAVKRSSRKPAAAPVTARHPSLARAAALRHRFRSRARLYGAWMSIGHPEVAAIFSRAQGDFLGIDLEHTTIELSTAQQIIRACHEHDRACLPRIYPGQLEHVRRLLDAGADGIIVPQVARVEDIDQVVDVMRYPPDGHRGFGVASAQGYGRDFDGYVRGANESLSLMIQIETIQAVERIGALLTHPAVDGVMVGPYDMSGSLGVPGELDHPRVREACETVVRACAQAEISCGMHLVYPTVDAIRQKLRAGFTFLVLGSDIFNLWKRGLEVDAMIKACADDKAAR